MLLYLGLAVLVSVAYAVAIYWDVNRLIADTALRSQMQKSVVSPLVRVLLTLVGHFCVLFVYRWALDGQSTVSFVLSFIALYIFPTAFVLSSVFIKLMRKGAILLYVGVMLAVNLFLFAMGVL